MRIQILSDLHTEYHGDSGRKFIFEYLQPSGVDILIIAGDIGVGVDMVRALRLILGRYPETEVLYVPGNQDFYGMDILYCLQQFKRLERKYQNLHVLTNQVVSINGIQFVGSTLWFPKQKGYQEYEGLISDFAMIPEFRKHVFKQHKKAVKFLQWHVTNNSIVISHHLPSHTSLPLQYVNDPVSMFFVSSMEELMIERKPKLWVHGHIHESCNYMLHKTHVVCNPLGFINRKVNAQFIPNMMIDM